METQSFMRNFFNNFLPRSPLQAVSSPSEAAASGQQQGASNLISKGLPWVRGPARALEPFSGFLDPLCCIRERRRAPETVIINQFSVRGGIRVFFSPHSCHGGWPGISGPETELVGKLGFCLAFFFGGGGSPILSLLVDVVARSLLHKNLFQQTLCPPLPKRNLPWPGGKSRWTLFSALGPLRLSPHTALAQTITPFKKNSSVAMRQTF